MRGVERRNAGGSPLTGLRRRCGKTLAAQNAEPHRKRHVRRKIPEEAAAATSIARRLNDECPGKHRNCVPAAPHDGQRLEPREAVPRTRGCRHNKLLPNRSRLIGSLIACIRQGEVEVPAECTLRKWIDGRVTGSQVVRKPGSGRGSGGSQSSMRVTERQRRLPCRHDQHAADESRRESGTRMKHAAYLIWQSEGNGQRTVKEERIFESARMSCLMHSTPSAGRPQSNALSCRQRG